MRKFFSLTLCLIVLNSCISRIEKHGYSFDLADHEQVETGITTKENLIKIMGSPTFISDLDSDEAWIYYSEDVRHLLFFRPKVVARNLWAIRFNKNKTIKSLEKITLDNEKKGLSFSSDHTQVESHKIGLLKSFFSNVGQIKPQ